MPKRTFDEFVADAQVAAQSAMATFCASIVANTACLDAKKACLDAQKACLDAQMSITQRQIYDMCVDICVLEYGPRSIDVVPRIQACFRGILTRKRVHFALLSAEPDAVEYALCLCGAL